VTEASAWRAPLAVTACVAAELGIASAPLGPRMRIALLLGMAALAVGICLAEAMGLRRASRGIRAIILVPLGLSVVTAVVLMLEAWFHAGQVLR
jgi:hypothetical protein